MKIAMIQNMPSPRAVVMGHKIKTTYEFTRAPGEWFLTCEVMDKHHALQMLRFNFDFVGYDTALVLDGPMENPDPLYRNLPPLPEREASEVQIPQVVKPFKLIKPIKPIKSRVSPIKDRIRPDKPLDASEDDPYQYDVDPDAEGVSPFDDRKVQDFGDVRPLQRKTSEIVGVTDAEYNEWSQTIPGIEEPVTRNGLMKYAASQGLTVDISMTKLQIIKQIYHKDQI